MHIDTIMFLEGMADLQFQIKSFSGEGVRAVVDRQALPLTVTCVGDCRIPCGNGTVGCFGVEVERWASEFSAEFLCPEPLFAEDATDHVIALARRACRGFRPDVRISLRQDTPSVLFLRPGPVYISMSIPTWLDVYVAASGDHDDGARDMDPNKGYRKVW